MLRASEPQPPPQLQTREPHPTRPPLPPPTQKLGGPPKLKNIKWLEKKKSNLENQIRRNPNNRKAINQLEGVLKHLGS